jgi:radical SAM superfamily enzyme YgiQ (UPF0313 family)
MTGALEATRGCPYRCEFCPETNIPGGDIFYKRPIPEVIEEIKKIPQKTLMFYDTSLTIDPAYTKELFQNMKRLRKRFFCNGNADALAKDEDLVRLSKEAGCVAWLIGFESISQDTLDSVGKKTNKVIDYAQAIKNIHKHHMVVIGDFIFGFDTDTKNVFEQTLKAVKELNIDVADFSILTPFPGTPLFYKLESQSRILTKDWTLFNMGHAVFRPFHMSPAELENGVRGVYNEFYGKAYTLRRITRGVRLGLYPFFVIVARNIIAMMGRRRLAKKEK